MTNHEATSMRFLRGAAWFALTGAAGLLALKYSDYPFDLYHVVSVLVLCAVFGAVMAYLDQVQHVINALLDDVFGKLSRKDD